MEDKSWLWRWPEKGQHPNALVKEARSRIQSPYESTPPPFCYPGTPLTLPEELLALAAELLNKQLNCIGCHTEAGEHEGGFASTQTIEAQAINMIAGELGGSPETVDGFFCTGGTGGNLQGLWLGREWLRHEITLPEKAEQFGFNKSGVVVFATPLTHYSVFKAASILDIANLEPKECQRCGMLHFSSHATGHGGVVIPLGINEQGEMSMEQLRSHFAQMRNLGYRRFMVVPTLGTTGMGSIDPIAKIAAFASEVNKGESRMYVHVDAAFGGFTVPFANPDFPAAFQNVGVQSASLDGHKMGQLPYPSGVFLCRKGLLKHVSRPVNYIRGHMDETLEGSRTAIAGILAWSQCHILGREGQMAYVGQCLQQRDELVKLILDRFPQANNLSGASPVKLLPFSPYVNILPLEVAVDLSQQEAVKAYELRIDLVPSNPKDPFSCPRKISKICVMPHTFDFLQRFVADLAIAAAQ